MKLSTRRQFIVSSGAVSTAAFAGCSATEPPKSENETTTDVDPGMVLSKAGPDPFSDADDVYSGWLHVVLNDDEYAMTFDMRICHGRNDVIDASLIRGTSSKYVLRFTYEPGDGDVNECDYGTRYNGAANLPLDLETVEVSFDGTTVQTLDKRGNLGEFRPLPDPLDPRDY